MSIILALLWSVRSLRTLLRQTALWQTKKYRLDRFSAHLRLPSTLRRLAHPLLTIRWGLLALFIARPDVARSGAGVGLLGLVYADECARFFWELRTWRFRRPRPTAKAVAILALGASVLAALAAWGWSTALPQTTLLLALDLLTPLLVALVTMAFAPLTAVQRQRTIRSATARIRTRPDLVTVGVTGSYGKSSTKEFLATMLGERFRVLKTPANVNTEIGVAQTILRSLTDTHEIFVCEMGAYRVGEIARAASVARPQIGILTAIGEQHLALFGSPARLAQAKGELLRALPPEGTAVVNGDDPRCVALLAETKARQTIRYGLGTASDVRADRIAIERTELTFRLHLREATRTVRAPLLGAQQIPSILAAASAAQALGLTIDEIAAGIERLQPLPRTMEPRSGPHGSFVVDDSYSANPEGVIAALEYFRRVPAQTRVVVMTTMIELGPAAAEAHRLVGEALHALQPTRTILTALDYAADIVRGAAVGDGATPRIVVETNPIRARNLVEPLLGPETAVLLEGRIPDRLRSALLVP